MSGSVGEGAWLSIIALSAWAILAFGAYRSYRIDTAKTLRMALTWAAIFTGVALLFGLVL
ncbi:hypothetical protein GRI62_06280 [Erythrobacter arachoides]|uniref:Uncharacterized protein n=1 Tax=Aurantiacibacter arachoides TaxID=1850444 RepID=A0A844ZYI2_9SPHN|nr:hypothetical protein [Aurantiacibacter arachoides]MXO93213.1 hypothetical protein [Aurantiacibacter arachoides]GGD51123.1 hypothetical protein GCM10011411_08700 [Aurantiacibacter arachoides]